MSVSLIQRPIDLNSTDTFGTLPTAKGGTGITSVSSTEFGYLVGVTSAIQTQLNGKEPTISTGTTAEYIRGDKSLATLNQAAVAGLTTASSPSFTGLTVSGLAASRALTTDTGGLLAVSAVTSAELGHLSGTTSAIQTQLNDRLLLAGGTMTGAIIGISGSAAAVAFSSGGAGSGLYSSAANTVDLSTDSVSRLRVYPRYAALLGDSAPGASQQGLRVAFSSEAGSFTAGYPGVDVFNTRNDTGSCFSAIRVAATRNSVSLFILADGNGTLLGAPGTYIGNSSAHPMFFRTNAISQGQVNSSGSWVLGPSTANVAHDIQGSARIGGTSAVNANSPLMSGAGISLAAAATHELSTNQFNGMIMIQDSSLGAFAIFILRGAGATTVEVVDSAGVYSNTVGGSTYNIYWNAGTSRYRLQNNSAGTVTFSVWGMAQYNVGAGALL
jgi:hypothetical protein